MATIPELRRHFDSLPTFQKQQFCQKVKAKADASGSMEMRNFANECFAKYNMEARQGPPPTARRQAYHHPPPPQYAQPYQQQYGYGGGVGAPGRLFLLITGIIYIIAGVGYAAYALWIVQVGAAARAMLGGLGMFGINMGGFFGVVTIIVVIFAVWYSLVGIWVIKSKDNVHKAGTLFTLGIVNAAAGAVFVMLVPFAFLWLAVPALHIYGAYRNKRGY